MLNYFTIKKVKIGLIFQLYNSLTLYIKYNKTFQKNHEKGTLFAKKLHFFHTYFMLISSTTYPSVFVSKVSKRTEMGASDSILYMQELQ